MLGAVALMTACSDDGGGSGSGSIDYEEGYKYLSSLNVSDAKMIYQKTSSAGMKSRAAGDEDGTYYKLDLNGEESKLVITGEDGQDYNIGINFIIKLSDRILLVNPNASDIIKLLPKPAPNEPVPGISNAQFLSIVDKQNEKVYKCPDEISSSIYENISDTDSKGNIYLLCDHSQIYKLNVSDFTIQQMLPNGQTITDFKVTDDGFIIYWNDNQYRVKCPGGSIVPITGIGFYFDNNIYSIENDSIYIWKVIDNNHLKKTEVCAFEGNWGEGPILTNYARNSVVFRYSGYNNAAEFDGNKITEVSLPDDFHNISNMMYQDFYVTNKAWYITGNAELHKLDMNTYQDYKIPVLDYELQTISASPESPNITFTGFRYSDGANVVGTIDENDKITIDNVADNGEKIINLIPLN